MPYIRHRRSPWTIWDYSFCIVMLGIAGCAFLYAFEIFWAPILEMLQSAGALRN